MASNSNGKDVNAYLDEYAPIFTEDSLEIFKPTDMKNETTNSYASNEKKKIDQRQEPDSGNRASDKKNDDNFISINEFHTGKKVNEFQNFESKNPADSKCKKTTST